MPQTQTGTPTENTYEFTIPTTIPTRQGYTFVAWVENIHSSEGIQPGSKITVGNSYGTIFTKTLYAVWKGENVSYTLNYNANGGIYTGTDPYIEPTTAGCQTNTGMCNVQLSSYYPYRDGYTFEGWSDSASATVATYQPNDIITLTSDSIIYAVWKDNAGVEYEILSGGGSRYVINSGRPLVIKGSGELSKFVELRVDGLTVATDKYTKEAGSTVITISADYLNTLSVGNHTATLTWEDGEASTDFTIVAADSSGVEVPNTSVGTPETGTNTGNNIGGGIAVVVLPIMLAGLATFAYRRNINKAHRKFN